jgi:hypothetical protein
MGTPEGRVADEIAQSRTGSEKKVELERNRLNLDDVVKPDEHFPTPY